MNCYDLDSLKDVTEQEDDNTKDEFTRLAEMLSTRELDAVRAHGGDMHRQPLQTDEKIRRNDNKKPVAAKPATPGANRVVLDNSSPDEGTSRSIAHVHNGRLTGIYGNYLLVRPYPSLRILFTSPSMRVPGILQSPLLERIGGSSRMREQLVKAFSEGQSVTAKVRWLNVSHKAPKSERQKPSTSALEARTEREGPELPGRPRWLHCTPLVGASGTVGVWMIVIVDDEAHPSLTRHPPSISLKSSFAEDDFDILEPEPEPQRSPPRPPLHARKSSETLEPPEPADPTEPAEPPAMARVRRNTYKSLLATRDLKASMRSRGQAAGRFFNLAALSRASLASTQGESQVRIPLARRDSVK